MNNNVWVIVLESSIDLDTRIAVFDSAIKADKVFKEIAEQIFSEQDTDYDDCGNTLEECIEAGYCDIDGDRVSLIAHKLNDTSDFYWH